MTITQPDLFSAPVLLSNKAPDTSREAAKAAQPKAGTKRALVLECIGNYGLFGATDENIQEALHMPANTERPRRVELASAGLIKDSGRRRKTVQNNNAIVWVLA